MFGSIFSLLVKLQSKQTMPQNPHNKESLSLSHLVVDRHDPLIVEQLHQAPIYKKHAEVKAQVASGGEVIITQLSDGTKETVNTAKTGDYIVTNPSGEKYVISAEKFLKRYEPKPGEPGVFLAKGHCKAIPNPWKRPIKLLASWGEWQYGNADCMIATTFDPETHEEGKDPYIIGKREFEQTYKIVN